MSENVSRDTKYIRQFLLLTPTQTGGPWNPSPRRLGPFEHRNPLDMAFVAVPFGLRWAIRTEKSACYGTCGCPFRASDGLFEQRNPLDMVLVAVPSARGHESRLRKKTSNS